MLQGVFSFACGTEKDYNEQKQVWRLLMKYTLDQSNYHTGTVYEVNKLPPRSYFIPYPDRASADSVSLARKRYDSPLVQCLNGQWDFRFYPRPAELPARLDTDAVPWERITVPGCWQLQGYDRPFYLNCRYQFPFDPPGIPQTEPVGKVFALAGADGHKPGYAVPKDEYNFVGVYRRTLHLDDAKGSFVLSFLGVCACLDLYLNGRYVGYSEGSHNTAEFDLTGFLQEGENELLAVVRRWCSGTYLECQDMFRHNGIFRDVLLRRPCPLWDVEAKPEKTGSSYRLTASALLAEDGPVRITLRGHGLERSCLASASDGIASARFDALDVSEWTAETPVLYDLYFETDAVCIKCRIGFREVRIEGRRFLVNGTAIKLHGVNHHDTSPVGGFTMTPEELERDVRLCKDYNIDTVRTSHYPPDPYFLELCDEEGLYVVDEADLETHGTFIHRLPPSYNRISHDPFWQKHYLDRALRLYERDKLHPCVILWSLGNESGGFRNTDLMYEALKKRTSVPIHYEGVIHSRRKAYDVGSQMYPSVEQVRLVGRGASKTRQLNDRPYFLCEYAHAMGVGPGAMEEYWREIYACDALMGGCIWEMADHAILHPDGRYTYGGDHGEWCHDSNFCVDGIFYPDRTPSTGARIARFVYRPIRVTCVGENRFEVFNTTGFTHGSAYTLQFEWSDGRTAVLSPDVPPLEKRIFTVTPSGEPHPSEGFGFRVTVTTTERESGRTAAVEQLVLSEPALPSPVRSAAPLPADLSVTEGVLRIDGLLAASAPHTLLTRVATDNDKDLLGRVPIAAFYGVTEEPVSTQRQGNVLTVVTRLRFPHARFLCTDTYETTADGVLVTCRLHCEKGRGDLPRFGKCYRLDRSFDRVTYWGRTGESYRDMKDHCPLGTVTCSVRDMTEPNLRPQESGNRTDCQYVSLSDGVRQISFTAVDGPFELAVKPYSDGELSRMKHREDELASGTYVTVQAFQMGIGTGSCGPATRPEYRFDCRQDHRFSFLLRWGPSPHNPAAIPQV